MNNDSTGQICYFDEFVILTYFTPDDNKLIS